MGDSVGHVRSILQFLKTPGPGLSLALTLTWSIGTAHAQSTDVESALGRLSTHQKLGQLLVFGFSGQRLDDGLKNLIQETQPGAIIVFGRNIATLPQIQSLNAGAQAFSRAQNGVPLFVMVDQEGGNVARLHVDTLLPSALALGETRDPQLVQTYGEAMGRLMSSLGFTVNLAPVLDLSDPNSTSFIGPRSFGGQPEQVGLMSSAFAKGIALGGVMPTAKHFPGHGGVQQDSHQTTPQKLQTLKELESGDLVPFKRFAKADFPRAVMMAHISYPQVDPSGTPSGFSNVWIEQILKQRLRYQGLVITDDVEMSGAKMAGSVDERVVRAIEAGNDMVMVAWSAERQKRALRALEAAVQSGRLSIERINESVRRILNYKLQLESVKQPATELTLLKTKLQNLALRIKRYNFVKTEAANARVQGQFSNRGYLNIFASDPRFFRAFAARYGRWARYFRISATTQMQMQDRMKKIPGVFVYYASGLKTARWLNDLTPDLKKRLIVVNTLQPGAIENKSNYAAVFQMNTLSPESGAWLADFLIEKPKIGSNSRFRRPRG